MKTPNNNLSKTGAIAIDQIIQHQDLQQLSAQG